MKSRYLHQKTPARVREFSDVVLCTVLYVEICETRIGLDERLTTCNIGSH